MMKNESKTTMNPTDAASMIDKELEAQTTRYSLLNWRMWFLRAIWFVAGFACNWSWHNV